MSKRIEIFQDKADALNSNANIQLADTDVSDTNPIPIKQNEISEVSAGSQNTLSDTGGTGVYFGTVDVQDGSFKNLCIGLTIVTTTDESTSAITVKWGFAPSDLGVNCTTQIGDSANTGALSLPNNDTTYYYTVEFARKDRYLHIWYDYDALSAGNTASLDIDIVRV